MTDLQAKIKEYREYALLAAKYEALKSNIADEIKAAMDANGENSLIIGEYKVTYTLTKRETLDKKRLEADLGDLSEYVKVTEFKRFTVA